MNNAAPPCAVCESDAEPSPRFVKDGFRIWRCSDCRLLFVHPQPSAQEIDAIYDAAYFRRGGKYEGTKAERISSQDSHDRARATWLIDRVSAGRVLDVGCATGGFVEQARAVGFDAVGVEPSAHACDIARNRGLDVIQGDLESAALPPAGFDVVTLWDVLEHVAQPRSLLEEIHRVLKPGAIAVISTGDAASWWARLSGSRWQLLTPPQHLFYFNDSSLSRLLAQTGFEIESVGRPGKRTTLEFLAFKAGESFGGPFRGVHKLIAGTAVGRAGLYLNLRDIMHCVARKR